MGGLKRLAVAGADRKHLHDPAGADPCLADVFRCLLGAQRPGDVATVADLVSPCYERDLALALELAVDLTVEVFLVRLDRQEEVGCQMSIRLIGSNRLTPPFTLIDLGQVISSNERLGWFGLISYEDCSA